MARKISQLEAATDVTANDLLQVVDVEDGVMAASGTNKRITAQLLANQLFSLMDDRVIPGSKIEDGAITSAKIESGAIIDSDVNASAAIASTKLAPITATGSTTARSLANRFADTVNVKDFGAVGDGVTDDTAAFLAAVAASRCIIIPSKGTYLVKNITLSNSQRISGSGAVIKAAAGAEFIFKLTNYSSGISDIYISEANCSKAAIIVASSRFAFINNVRILNTINAGSVILLDPTEGGSGNNANKLQISNVVFEGFPAVGLNIKANCSELNAINLYIDCGMLPPYTSPRDNAIGVNQDSTGRTSASGGHCYVNTTTINSEYGWVFTNAQLTKLSNCIADGHSRDGVKLAGESYYIDFSGMFIGSCGRGINAGNNCTSISFAGLRTSLIGVTPPWGSSSFYKYSAPIYEAVTNDTAKIGIDADSWFGAKRISEATGSNLIVTGGQIHNFCASSAVPSNTVVYFSNGEQQASEINAEIIAPYDCYLIEILGSSNFAPGASQSNTYTARINGVDQALSCVTTGTDAFLSKLVSSIYCPKNSKISIKLTTSATSAPAGHRGYLKLVPAV
jgi:hypothetical protein